MDAIFDDLIQDFSARASDLTPVADGEGADDAQPSPVGGEPIFPAPVLAEPPTGSDLEHLRSGEARESTRTPEITGRSDSRGGENLSKVLGSLEAFLGRYVNFPKASQAPAVALWVAHTWVFERFRYSPMLHIFSPEKRCGKSVLLDALALVVARPWKIDNLSEAALFHKAEEQTPTMLWDEVDNIFHNEKDNAPIIGLLNAGFKRGGKAVRVPRGNLEEYDVYCPKALCGIGRIPDTTHDRCIDIKLARAKGKQVFREEDAEAEAAVIRKALADWAKNLAPDAHKLAVSFPAEYRDNGRQCDITEPLLIIAALAGLDWTERARESLGELCSSVDDFSVGIQLLKDCRGIFFEHNCERMFTKALLEWLIKIEDANSPWPVWWEGDVKFGKTGGPAKKLATYLKNYGITPHTLSIEGESGKGYVKADFHDAWGRYVTEPLKLDTAELDLDL